MVTQNSSRQSNDQVRSLILRYLYDRNASATSARGKRGAAVKIGDMRRELKEMHRLTREQVVSNLRYLISQGWVEEQTQERVVPTNAGRQIPSATIFYAITARGIDKIEGPSDYTPRDRFAGILNINANGQNTVTVGDGNQISVKYEEQGEALAALSDDIKQSADLSPDRKMDAVADIDTIQAQLARSSPNVGVIRSAWASIEPLTKIATLASSVLEVGEKLTPLLS